MLRLASFDPGMQHLQCRRLLRPRRKRPRDRRTAEQRDELATFHRQVPLAERIAHLSTQEAAALRDFVPIYVGDG
jgi:hypothetical protein